MAKSGSDNRRRQVTLSSRFSDEEARLVRSSADRAGMSVASLIRYALLELPPPRAARSPTVDHETAGKMLAELGRIRQEFRDAIDAGSVDADNPQVDAVLRDFAEMRLVWFEALGRAP